MITVAVPMPPIASGNAATDTASRMSYEKKINAHIKRKLKLDEKCTKAYSLFEGQCTKATKEKLKSHANYVQTEASYGVFLPTRTL